MFSIIHSPKSQLVMKKIGEHGIQKSTSRDFQGILMHVNHVVAYLEE